MRTLVTGICFSSKNENTPHDFKNMCEWRQRSPSLFPLVVGWLFYSLLVAYFAPVWFFCSSRDNNTELCFGGHVTFPPEKRCWALALWVRVRGSVFIVQWEH